MSTQFETLGQALEAFPKRRFQVLAAPRLMDPVPNLRLTATVVMIKPNTPKTYRKEELQGWAITKAGLLELAQEAGIKFGRTQLSYDEEHSPTATVMGKRMIAPGQWSEMPGTYALNRTDRIKELEGRIEEAQKDSEFDQDVLKKMREELVTRTASLDRYGEAMAETGAMLRIVRAMLGIEHVYTAQELRKAFVVMRLDVVADEEAVKLAQQVVGVTAGELYGEEPPRQGQDATMTLLAQALLDKIAPPTPQDGPQGQEGGGERGYSAELIKFRNLILKEGMEAGISVMELSKRAREQFGKTLWRLNLLELKQAWARWFDAPRAKGVVVGEGVHIDRG